jgi:hypothetical protein
MLARADLWLVVLAGCALALLSVVNVTLGQGLGDRCHDCFLVPTWGALYTFQGVGPNGDISQDMLGARRMLQGGEAYPIYGPALAEIGLPGQVIPHASTHPPTAFLFGLPFADLNWSEAAPRWAIWAMAAFIVSWRAVGLGWSAAFALAGWGLLWPPLASSTGSLTPLWLLGQALAWRWRGVPALAGAALGVAAFTKFLPALLLGPFVLQRRWTALAGFAGVAMAAFGLVLWLAPGTVEEYLRVGVPTAAEQVMRPDNGALFFFAAYRIRSPAPLLVAAMVAAMLVSAVRAALAAPVLERRTWGLWAWLAVALLPISWQASLLPLATELVAVIRSGGLPARLLACAAVVSPVVLPWDGHLGRNGEGVFLCVVFAGVALALNHGRPGAACPRNVEAPARLRSSVQ